MDSPIFRQQNELRDWLTGQPQVTHRKLAMLGALRILPLALEKPIGDLETSVDQWTEADALEHDQRCLAIFRAAITGTTAAWDENPLLDHAAKEARENLRKLEKTKRAVLRTTSKAASIFKFAALVNSPDIQSRDRSAKFAAFSLEEGWTLLRDVSTATEREEWQVDPELAWDVAHNVALLSHPHQRLFNASSQPSQSTHAWASFCAKTKPKSTLWQFWRDWYQGILDGAPMDWGLQLQIALIEDAIWNAGPEAVAAEIEAIKAQFLSEKAPLAEVVEFDDNIGAFSVIPQEIAKPTLLAATLSQVEDALDVVLADPSNGLNERSRETQVLRRNLLKYSNDPQRIEMDFFSVHAGLTRQIVVEDLPTSEANLALQRALEEGAQAVRATHPDVAENRHILNSQKIAELTTDQKAKLAGAQPLLEAISSGVMQEDFSDDIAYLLEDHFRVPTSPPEFVAKHRNPILTGSDEKYRTFGRLAQIAIQLLKSPQILDRIDGSAGYKAATIFLTVKELINLCIGLI